MRLGASMLLILFFDREVDSTGICRLYCTLVKKCREFTHYNLVHARIHVAFS